MISRLKELTTQTETDLIREYFAMSAEEKDKFVLSNQIERKLAMIEAVKENIGLDSPKAKILEHLMSQYDITLRHAANMYDLALSLFDIVQIKLDMLFKDIRETQTLSEKNEDPRAKAAAEKNKLSAIQMLESRKENKGGAAVTPIIMIGFFPEMVMTEDASLEEIQAYIDKERGQYKTRLLAEDTISEEAGEEDKI